MTKSQTPKIDRRLLGVWRSDRGRTFRNYKPGPKSTPRSSRRFKAIFGKLRVRWTRKFVYTEYEASRSRSSYAVVASDRISVVVCIDDELLHVHFEGDHYWIGVKGILCEHFNRVKRPPRRVRRRA
jgi:hypothetical protein